MEIETEESKTDEKSLTDLTVTDEQSDSTKGGADGVIPRPKAAIGAILGGAAGAGSL